VRWAAPLAVLAIVTGSLSTVHRLRENVSAIVSATAPKPGSVHPATVPTCPALTIVPAGRFNKDRTTSMAIPRHSKSRRIGLLIGARLPSPPVPSPWTNSAVHCRYRAGHAWLATRTMTGGGIRPDANWENPGFVQTGSQPGHLCLLGLTPRPTRDVIEDNRTSIPAAKRAEWEYAARAGGEAVRPLESRWIGRLCRRQRGRPTRGGRRYPGWAVFPCDDGYVYTAPVGSFKANSFGLNDMVGKRFSVEPTIAGTRIIRACRPTAHRARTAIAPSAS